MVMAIEGLLRLLCQKIGREAIDLAVFNANVETIDRSLIRSNQTNIFYDEIEQFRHAGFLIRSCPLMTRAQSIVLCWWRTTPHNVCLKRAIQASQLNR